MLQFGTTMHPQHWTPFLGRVPCYMSRLLSPQSRSVNFRTVCTMSFSTSNILNNTSLCSILHINVRSMRADGIIPSKKTRSTTGDPLHMLASWRLSGDFWWANIKSRPEDQMDSVQVKLMQRASTSLESTGRLLSTFKPVYKVCSKTSPSVCSAETTSCESIKLIVSGANTDIIESKARRQLQLFLSLYRPFLMCTATTDKIFG